MFDKLYIALNYHVVMVIILFHFNVLTQSMKVPYTSAFNTTLLYMFEE